VIRYLDRIVVAAAVTGGRAVRITAASDVRQLQPR